MTHRNTNDITGPSELTPSGLQVEPTITGGDQVDGAPAADPLSVWLREWKPRPGFVSLDQLVQSVEDNPMLRAQVVLDGETVKDAVLRVLSAGHTVAVGHTMHVTRPLPSHVWGARAWVVDWGKSMVYERRLERADHMHFKVEVPAVRVPSDEELELEGAVGEVRELGEPEITRVESESLPPGYHLMGLLVEDQVLAFQAAAADGSWHSPMTTRESDAIGQAWRQAGAK